MSKPDRSEMPHVFAWDTEYGSDCAKCGLGVGDRVHQAAASEMPEKPARWLVNFKNEIVAQDDEGPYVLVKDYDLLRAHALSLREELAEEKRQTKIMLDSYAEENQRLFDKAESAERELSECRRDAEVIGNVTAALLDLDVTYDGNRATFTFLSTNNAMSYIHKARDIVTERLARIRAALDAAAEEGK